MQNRPTEFQQNLQTGIEQLRRKPDPHFSGRVMKRIAETKVIKFRPFDDIMQKAFPYVMGMCVIVLLVISVQLLVLGGPPSGDLIIGVPEISPDDALALIEN